MRSTAHSRTPSGNDFNHNRGKIGVSRDIVQISGIELARQKVTFIGSHPGTRCHARSPKEFQDLSTEDVVAISRHHMTGTRNVEELTPVRKSKILTYTFIRQHIRHTAAHEQ